jgi:hypothetical protein
MFRTTAFKGCAFLVVERILAVVNGVLAIVPEVNGNSRESGSTPTPGLGYLTCPDCQATTGHQISDELSPPRVPLDWTYPCRDRPTARFLVALGISPGT